MAVSAMTGSCLRAAPSGAAVVVVAGCSLTGFCLPLSGFSVACCYRYEQAFTIPNMRSQGDDRTAKAVILHEAMRLIAARGVDGVTVREVAAAASVSPALVMQHYGSKEGLRAAVDDRVLERFSEMIATVTGDGPASSILEAAATFFPPGSPLPEYLGRMLVGSGSGSVSGSEPDAGAEMFRRLFEAAQRGLDAMVASGSAAPGQNPAARAAFLLVNDLAVIMLRRRVQQVVGFDPLSADGIEVWGRELLAIYSKGLSGS